MVLAAPVVIPVAIPAVVALALGCVGVVKRAFEVGPRG
jgi:hypothetical protein